ncbi:MAG: BamA/TamA family outer membrane protein [Candidatus Omnitrophica bacterium]|nr:BamA/TamA family outer membrane protein [Candidatus Omnitrophota bacterium]
MSKTIQRAFTAITIVLLVYSQATCGWADSVSTQDPESYPAAQWRPWLNLPTTITNYIKRPFETGVIYLDKHHVYEKVDHVIDTLQDHGIYPFWYDINNENFTDDGVGFRNGIYDSSKSNGILGVKYERTDLFEDELTCDLGSSSWYTYQPWNGNTDMGTRLSFAKITEYEIYTALTARYQKYPRELFYGVGRHYSVANKYDYTAQETSLDYIIGKEEIFPMVNFEIGVGYSKIDISDGRIKGPANLSAFPGITGRGINNISGADLFTYGASLIHDTRTDPLHPSDGGYEKLIFAMNHGVDDDDNVQYWKLRGDAIRYLPLHKYFPKLSADKIIALRGMVEKNVGFDGDQIPFFDLARLDRQLVRGYTTNRFLDKNALAFSAEYRYTIWRWKEFKMNAALFYDFGWSFDSFSTLRGSEVKDSFGLALRVLLPGTNVIALEGARSDEGYEVLLKWKPRF